MCLTSIYLVVGPDSDAIVPRRLAIVGVSVASARCKQAASELTTETDRPDSPPPSGGGELGRGDNGYATSVGPTASTRAGSIDADMDLDEFNGFCGDLAGATHVVQWGGAHVWKVGGKVFAIGGWDEDGEVTGITFKTSTDEYEFLIEMPGVRPAPYLASRGFTWVQHYADPGLDHDDLCEQLVESHRLVASGLSKKKQRELGLLDDG